MDLRVATAIALASAAFLFFGLSRYGVVNVDEGIYHAIAERMVASGDVFRLDFRGEPRPYDAFMNAPLHYWARAALIAVLGSNHFTMRALSALFGVLTVVATYALGCRVAGRRAGLLAAAVQITTFHFVYLHGARTGELDTIVTCLVATACVCFLRGVEDQRSFLPHHLALAALLMTKLPLVIVPIAAESLWLAAHPELRRHLRRYLLSGLAVLPFALLWHAGQAVALRDELLAIAGSMLGHASGAGDTGMEHVGPLGNLRFYASAVLYGALPWAAIYPFAATAALGRDEHARPRRIALLFAVVVFAFFAFVSKHFAWYVMPAYPFLSVLTGAWLADLMHPERAAARGLAVGAIAATCLWLGVDALGTNPFAERALAMPMETRPRAWLGLSPWPAILLFGAAWAAAGWALRERLSSAAIRPIGQAFTAALLLFAAVRVAAPLAHLDHESRLARTHRQIFEMRRAGEPLRYPIRLGAAPPMLARFLFAEDFEIAFGEPGARGPELLLFPRGDPRVLDRSIGRLGMERRFERLRRRSGSAP